MLTKEEILKKLEKKFREYFWEIEEGGKWDLFWRRCCKEKKVGFVRYERKKEWFSDEEVKGSRYAVDIYICLKCGKETKSTF